MTLSNLPPKGTYDWFPEEYAKRKYIFDTWRKVCVSFGYEEYLTPIIENADIYRAKSGEDVGGNELMTIKRDDEEFAIRPEMTPSVTRMITRIYETTSKPIRYFSIANFMRFQKPQKGRNREFWQLNCDIFGSDSIASDIEIISMAIEIMKTFGANSSQFVVYLNDRKLIESLVTGYLGVSSEKVAFATRILDKFEKITMEELKERLETEADAKVNDINELVDFLRNNKETVEKISKEYLGSEGTERINALIKSLDELGYGEFVTFNPSMVRGFDYYDGMIFEVFDKDKNDGISRSLFGGGRYNGLAGIFGARSFPAVGFAPGDETTKLFLEKYNLYPSLSAENDLYFVPILDESLIAETLKLANLLREEGKNVITGTEVTGIGKSLDYANKVNASFTVIFGTQEKEAGKYLVKNMKTGEQQETVK